MLTNAPKGTKDMMPDQAYKWHYIEEAFADICRRYGFSEIRTPVFEHTELFKRGVGGTTDIVQKEMYSFTDYGDRNITLKPEGTSPVVRAYTEHKLFAAVQPTKLYYNIPCFRYEKPQSGRLREFHQFGIETFGTSDMMADAEIISLAKDFLEEMGITDIELRINSVGCPQCRKRHREALREFLKPKYNDLCSTCKDRYEKNPMRILDCKSPVCQELIKGAPMMLDYLCDDCRDAFEDLKKNLDAMEIQYVVDPAIVRGLDYYTKTAFEFVTEKIGAQGTVCGGGRYDHLVEEIGGPETPGVGFGLGKERLLLTMEACGVEIPKPDGADVFIAVMGEEAKAAGLKLMRQLRKRGVSVQMDIMGRNIKNQFKYANRINAAKTVVIGQEELEKNSFAIKDMATSEQIMVPMEKIAEELSR
ncbi:MAG: histidine--tRNA ligase [Anaerovoracaceae bacterium]